MKPEWTIDAYGGYHREAGEHMCGYVYPNGNEFRWVGRNGLERVGGYAATLDKAKAEVERRCVHA